MLSQTFTRNLIKTEIDAKTNFILVVRQIIYNLKSVLEYNGKNITSSGFPSCFYHNKILLKYCWKCNFQFTRLEIQLSLNWLVTSCF